MHTPALIHGQPLAALNTFGIVATAKAYLPVSGVADLAAVLADPALRAMPRIVLGGGSNIVFTGAVDVLVLHMQNRGMHRTAEDDDYVYVTAAAGERWHDLVMWTLAEGLGGLENLSLIPGTVGAAPIQNIGAYGVEVKDVLHSLTVFDLETGEVREMLNGDCAFAYRDSIFKQALKDRVVVLDVTLALPKAWRANTRYGDIEKALGSELHPTPRQVSDAVIAIRQSKLPDPAVIGNAGSFFKNPVVTKEAYDALRAHYGDLIGYTQPDGSVKLAAGWLIEQCGWKGRSLGNAGVYDKQALVLVNHGGATGQDIVSLAEAIVQDVFARYQIMLEPEPVFV